MQEVSTVFLVRHRIRKEWDEFPNLAKELRARPEMKISHTEVSFKRVSQELLRNSRLLIEDFHCTSQCTDLYPSLPAAIGLQWEKSRRADAFPLLSPKSLNSKNRKHKEQDPSCAPCDSSNAEVCISWKLFGCCLLLGGLVSNGSRMMPFPSTIGPASCNHPDLSSLLCC